MSDVNKAVNRAINKIVARQDNIIKNELQRQQQRRNTVSDAKADFLTMLRSPARLYTGFFISKDINYLMRYAFSLHVRPFVSTYVDSEGNVSIIEHSMDPSSIRIAINQIDITDAIKLEYGSFVDGFGYFPAEDGKYFDLLEIVDYLYPWQQAVILSKGRKEIEISQNNNTLCECDISYQVKFNHINRGGPM